MPMELMSNCCWFQFLPAREEKSGQESVGLVLVGLFGFFVCRCLGFVWFWLFVFKKKRKTSNPLSPHSYTLTHTPVLTHIYTHTLTEPGKQHNYCRSRREAEQQAPEQDAGRAAVRPPLSSHIPRLGIHHSCPASISNYDAGCTVINFLWDIHYIEHMNVL